MIEFENDESLYSRDPSQIIATEDAGDFNFNTNTSRDESNLNTSGRRNYNSSISKQLLQ